MVASGFSRKEVTAAIKSVDLPAGFKTLEGLLFPAQYSFEDKTSAQSALTSMIEPLMIVGLAVVVGTIVIALFLPLTKIIEKLG